MKTRINIIAAAVAIMFAMTAYQTPAYAQGQPDTIITETATHHAHTLEDVPFGENPWAYGIKKGWHLSFEGIAFGQPYKDFVQALVARGYKITGKDAHTTTLEGTWNGIAGSTVLVYEQDDTAYRAETFGPETRVAADAKRQYDAVVKTLCEYTGIDEDSLSESLVQRISSEAGNSQSEFAHYPIVEGDISVDMGPFQNMVDLAMEEYPGLIKKLTGKAGKVAKARYRVHASFRDNLPTDKVKVGKEVLTLGELAGR